MSAPLDDSQAVFPPIEIDRRQPAPKMIFGECDNCAKPNRVLHHCWATCEAYVCSPCQGLPLADDIDDLLDEIERLLPEAKTDEQRAHVSALGAALDEARGGAA